MANPPRVRCCGRPERQINASRPGPSSAPLSQDGAATELGVPDHWEKDYWLEEIDHYVRAHTGGGGLASHVDARKIHRLLTRSGYETVPKHKHMLWRNFLWAVDRLLKFMEGKEHWTEGAQNPNYPRVPDFGGPEALIAIIILGGERGQFPKTWHDKWVRMGLGHLLYEVGCPVYKFWEGARLESPYWRKTHILPPRTEELAPKESSQLSIYIPEGDKRGPIEAHINEWTHVVPFRVLTQSDPVFARRENENISQTSGTLPFRPRHAPPADNRSTSRRQTIGSERGTRTTFSTPGPQQVAPASVSSLPGPGRRGGVRMGSERRESGDPRGNQTSTSKRRRQTSPQSAGSRTLTGSTSSPESPPRQQGKKPRQLSNRLSENDKPTPTRSTGQLARDQLSPSPEITFLGERPLPSGATKPTSSQATSTPGAARKSKSSSTKRSRLPQRVTSSALNRSTPVERQLTFNSAPDRSTSVGRQITPIPAPGRSTSVGTHLTPTPAAGRSTSVGTHLTPTPAAGRSTSVVQQITLTPAAGRSTSVGTHLTPTTAAPNVEVLRSPARGTESISSRGRAPAPTPVRNQPPPAAQATSSLAVQAERLDRVDHQQRAEVSATRSAATVPSTQCSDIGPVKLVIPSDDEDDLVELKPDPEMLKKSHEEEESKIMHEYLSDLEKYETIDVVKLLKYLNSRPANFWEKQMNRAVVLECTQDPETPKACDYKWNTDLRMIQGMFRKMGYLDRENRLVRGRVPRLDSEYVYADPNSD